MAADDTTACSTRNAEIARSEVLLPTLGQLVDLVDSIV